MIQIRAIPFTTSPKAKCSQEQPWYEEWMATVLALKSERVRHEKQLVPTPEGSLPTELTYERENACRTAYAAIYPFQVWQNRCQKILEDAGKLTFEGTKLERPDPPGEWVHERMRSSLHAWNATFGPEDGPVSDPNEWNPKTYAGQSEVFSDTLPGEADDDWGAV